MRQLRSALAWCTGALLLAVPTLAQQQGPGAMADQYAQKARQNAGMLRQFSWTMRVALTADGKTKPPQLYMMRYDVNGQLQKTPLTVQQQKTLKGIRGRIAKKKIAKAKDYAADLAELVKGYAAPKPSAMMDFYSGAEYTRQQNGTVVAVGANFLQKGDSVTFVVDPASRQPKSYNFNTQLGKDPVFGAVQFGQVPNGPRYAAQITVNVPSKKLKAQIDTFDYIPQQ